MTQDNDNSEEDLAPFWISGCFQVRVKGVRPGQERTVPVNRPFAIIGHAPDADIRINERGVNRQHAYLHVDHRGLYVVDLLSRSGTRIGRSNAQAGWLAPGECIEIAGTQIELLQIVIDGLEVEPTPGDHDPLALSRHDGLLPLGLIPRRKSDSPWSVNSELVFVGGSTKCGIHLKDDSVAKVQAAFFRTPVSAYLINIHGRNTRIDGEEVEGAAPLQAGQMVTLGSTSYFVSHELPNSSEEQLPALSSALSGEPPLVAHVIHPEVETASAATEPNEPPPSDAKDALLAWMIDAFRDTQNAMLRQQAEIQKMLGQLLEKTPPDNADLTHAHRSHLENLDREIKALRDEAANRASLPTPPTSQAPSLPSPPLAPPLRITRKEPEPVSDTAEPSAGAAWLLEKVSQLNDDQDAHLPAWKRWLSRVAFSRPKSS